VRGAWWDMSGGRNGGDSSSFFRRAADDSICFSFLSFCVFSFGLGCAAAPACSLYRVVAILI
jgi:hypothetical protein